MCPPGCCSLSTIVERFGCTLEARRWLCLLPARGTALRWCLAVGMEDVPRQGILLGRLVVAKAAVLRMARGVRVECVQHLSEVDRRGRCTLLIAVVCIEGHLLGGAPDLLGQPLEHVG